MLKLKNEKTLIVCNQLEDGEQVAKYLESKKVSVLLVKNIESDCKLFNVSTFIT